MIGLKVKEKDTSTVQRILQKFRVPFKQEKGSSVFILLDNYNAVDLLFYLARIGVKAFLTYHI